MSFVVESKHLTEPDDNGTQTLTLKLGPVDIDSNNEQDYKTAAKELYSLYSAFKSEGFDAEEAIYLVAQFLAVAHNK